MQRLLCCALFASLAAVASPQARAGRLLDLAVVDRDTGATLPTYASRGKLYVAGTPGHRYSVRLSNRSGARVLAVLSVDGVNAVSGETASPEQSGYVLDPWETTEIAGWRKSLDEIAQFNFTALPDSYAARTDRPANVGVIGVAVFTERAPVWRERRDEIAQAPAAAPKAEAGAAEAESSARAQAMPAPALPKPSSARSHAANASAPGTARASTRAWTPPRSCVRRARPPRRSPSGTTAAPTSSRRASCRGRSRAPNRSRFRAASCRIRRRDERF